MSAQSERLIRPMEAGVRHFDFGSKPSKFKVVRRGRLEFSNVRSLGVIEFCGNLLQQCVLRPGIDSREYNNGSLISRKRLGSKCVDCILPNQLTKAKMGGTYLSVFFEVAMNGVQDDEDVPSLVLSVPQG